MLLNILRVGSLRNLSEETLPFEEAEQSGQLLVLFVFELCSVGVAEVHKPLKFDILGEVGEQLLVLPAGGEHT